MKNIFLTGVSGAGKSTVIHKVLCLLPTIVCGGFRTVSAAPLTEGALMDVFIEKAWEPSPYDSSNLVGTRWGHGRFDAYPAVFETVGAAILASPQADASLILMDELGMMENDAPRFQAAVMAALDGSLPVLGVIKPKQTAFLDAVRSHERTYLFEVNEDNRDALPAQIAELLGHEIELIQKNK